MMGKVLVPNNDGLAISEAIVEGKCLLASDGSLMKDFCTQKGTHGYALRIKDCKSEDLKGFG